jgi:hypothetical protein
MLYLLHATDKDYTQITELQPSGTSDSELKYQYPGVYFSLITSENIETEVLFHKKYFLLFSIELLKQKNFHINIRDMNGIINEYNTFFYWQVKEALDGISLDAKVNNRTMNEVVFHNSINMQHLCKVVENTFDGSLKDKLPRIELRNNTRIDTDVLPCYCYYNESYYRGIHTPKKSSDEWIDKMNTLFHTNLLDHTFYERVKFLYENRTCIDYAKQI